MRFRTNNNGTRLKLYVGSKFSRTIWFNTNINMMILAAIIAMMVLTAVLISSLSGIDVH